LALTFSEQVSYIKQTDLSSGRYAPARTAADSVFQFGEAALELRFSPLDSPQALSDRPVEAHDKSPRWLLWQRCFEASCI